MKYPLFRFLTIIALSFCALLTDGCGSGDDGPSSEQTNRAQNVIGPEGGTVEVTDPNSPIKGVKVTVPPGAVAQKTTIFVEETWNAPKLPAGLSIDYPIINLGSGTPFLTDVEITFPVTYIPTSDQDILGVYYYNPAKAKWIIIPARKVSENKLTIKTTNFGLCRWGTVRLSEVDDDTIKASMEDMQSMFDAWSNLKQAMENKLQPLISVVENPTLSKNLARCDTQDQILSILASLRQDALQGVTDYLASSVVVNNCRICDRDNRCYSSCDPNKLISGQPIEWLQNEIQIYFRELFFSAVCPIDILGPICGKMVAWAKYQEAIRSLSCDWRCILKNGNLDFYLDLLVGNVCSFSIFGIEVYRSHNPCP
jgi:hypothetical protein